MAAQQKYRYSKKAGALNEAAFSVEAPMATPSAPASVRRSYGSASAPVQTSLPQGMFSNVGGGAVISDGILVGTPGAHAQYVDETRVDPHTGRLLPADLKPAPRANDTGLDPVSSRPGRRSMFFYTVEEGQRVRMIRPSGAVEILVGPRRVWRGRSRFVPMAHYVAHPGEFLIVRFRDGRQEHHPGPAHLWLDPAEHLEITREDALQLSAKEAVVVYSEDREAAGEVSRRIVYGPAAFVPEPGEWLHTFSWHGSRGGHDGYQKVPNALVFQKLWLLPDQMYHDVLDVRTADDAVLTIRLMLFFELSDIEKMLETSHDPIGDFVNATTSDVVDFTGRHDFESFKQNTDKLNDLGTYRQLVARAGQCGYRIDKVVYRGYGAPESLQRMHNEAIESRTRLQLERATQQQAQDLEDFTLERQLLRAGRQRTEEEARVSQELMLSGQRAEAKRARKEAERETQRVQRLRDAEQHLQISRQRDEQQHAHLGALMGMGVDLTKLLTQGRADRVIELRGAVGDAHLHMDGAEETRD